MRYFILCLFALTCSANDVQTCNQNNLLKQYFLVKCIENGLGRDIVRAKDHTSEMLREILKIDQKDLMKLDSVARKTLDTIPMSLMTGKRAVLFHCYEALLNNENEFFSKY